MIKPDGVNRGLVSEIVGRFEKRGYKLVAIRASARAAPTGPAWPLRDPGAMTECSDVSMFSPAAAT